MSLYTIFETNENAEVDGVWLEYSATTRVKIARAGGANKRFLKAADAFRRKFKRQLDLEILDDDVARKEGIQIYADSVVLDWEGVTDKEGNELAFSRENVVKVLTDLPDLFADIQAMAMKHAIFKAAEDEDDAGN